MKLSKFDERAVVVPASAVYLFLAWKVTSESYTIMRALALILERMPQSITIQDQYMFGPAVSCKSGHCTVI